MRIAFRSYARAKMALRSVSEADVRSAIENAHTSYTTPKNSICYIGPGVDGRDLKVWVFPHLPSATSLMVKTVAWRDNDDV
jgi:hypothetical protein